MTMRTMGCVAASAVVLASAGEVVEIGNRYGTLKVDTFGARAVSYVPAGGSEVLASLSDGTGGMPLCWPWFANEGPSADCRRHGVARYSKFGVAAKSGGELSLRLVSDAETRKHFPHDFELTVTFQLGEELTILVTGRNTGTDAFPVTEMIHPYFRVGSAADCVVRGVDGFRYQDNRHPELGDQRIWNGDYPIEDGSRVFEFNYQGVHRWLLEDPVIGRTLRFTGEGDLKTVVWNPGPATLQAANVTSHLKPGEWKTFVCVENGTTYRDRAYVLQPGERHVLRRTILVE